MFSYFLHFEPWNEWPSRIDGGQIQIQPLMVRSPCWMVKSCQIQMFHGEIQMFHGEIQMFHGEIPIFSGEILFFSWF